MPFAACCVLLALVTDIAYWGTASFLWETGSVWLLTVGLIVGGLVILAATVDLLRATRTHRPHPSRAALIGQAAAFALSYANVFVHSRDGYTAVVPEGLILSILAAIALVGGALADVTNEGARVGVLA